MNAKEAIEELSRMFAERAPSLGRTERVSESAREHSEDDEREQEHEDNRRSEHV